MKKILIILLLFLAQSVTASIFPPQMAVNHETQECSIVNLGDECSTCSLINGWEVGECPSGYTQKDIVLFGENYECTPRKDEFCCTEMHSGFNGDCEDLVINKNEKKCTFVNDINDCNALPPNWKEATTDPEWGKICPWEYRWVDEIRCIKDTGEDNIDDVDDVDDIDDINDVDNVIDDKRLIILGLIITGGLAVLLLYLVKNR